MSDNKLTKRPAAFAKGAIAGLAAILVFWACHLNEGEGDAKFNLTPDSAWAKCDFLTVELRDTAGTVLDTLFHGELKSLDQLNGLDASAYKGGRAVVNVIGTVNGNVCIEQSRTFDDKGGKVVVDTISLPGTAPKSVVISPATLSLELGAASVEIQALIKPAFADQVFEWDVVDPSVANLDLRFGDNDGRVFVVPIKKGTTKIKAKAKLDPTVVGEILVQVGSVDGQSISLTPDSLALYLGGPDSAFTAVIAPIDSKDVVEFSSTDEKIVTVDSKGRVKAVAAGTALVKAKFGSATAESRVTVKRDAPVLTISSKTGAAVNAPITFSPKATQEFGSIVMFKFDLQGDGSWDDSLPGPFLGATVDLPPQTASYPKEGKVKARFLVRDSEGNETIAEANIEIGNQPPETVSKSNDTLVSINDLVPFEAKVKDLEGKVALVGWDFDGDGKLDDSVKADAPEATIKTGRKFAKPGKHVAYLIATDDAGKSGLDSVRVLVVLDPPEADIGPDITVITGSPVAFSVKGKDKFGAIAKREIKVGAGAYLNLGKQDTTIVVPGDTGKIEVIGRVTDDDGNADEDTMYVTLVPPTKSNNDLASLIPTAGILAPEFKPAAIFYSLTVAYKDSMIAVTPVTADPKATLFVNSKVVASGSLSDSVAVAVGTTPKVFEILVTAQDGASKLYAVAVTRAPSSDASLANLEPAGFALKPGFAGGTFEYADTVAFKVLSATLKPTASHPAAKITVNDSVVASGTVSKALGLDVGDNLVKVVVTAQDGKTKSTYNVKIVRKAKIILSRTVGAVTAVTDSLEAPLGTTISPKAPDTTGFHFTKWSITEGSGTWQDSLVNPAKLTVKSATVRAKAAFDINVYTITGTIKGFVGGAYDKTTIKVEHGKDTGFTITPLVGQRIFTVTANGKALSLGDIKNPFGAKSFKLAAVTQDITLEAVFFKTYTLTVSASGEGTISPTGSIEVDSNSSQGFTLTSNSPETGVWVNTFTDNGADQTLALTGERMKVANYALKEIKENHTIAAGFAIRTYRMIVTGRDLCIQQVVVCPPPPQLCFKKLCLLGSGPDADTLTVNHGTKWTISTDDSLGTRPFLHWNKDGVQISTATSITTDPITADVTFNAVYKSVIVNCCVLGTCCVIIDPPILTPIGSTSIPVPTGTGGSGSPPPATEN